MLSHLHKILLLASVGFLLALGILLWVEHVVDDFWTMGLPLKVGSLEIDEWPTFYMFIIGLSILTCMRAVLKETVEIDIESARVGNIQTRMTFSLACWRTLWDVYEKLMDMFTILLAVMRFDIWIILFIVHACTVFILHASGISNGRTSRFP